MVIATLATILAYGLCATGIIGKFPSTTSLLAQYIFEVLYSVCITVTKLSILLLYRYLFAVRPFRFAVYAVGLYVTACGITQFFVTIFQCRPIQRSWDYVHVQGSCIQGLLFFYAAAILNLIADLVILLLPMPVVWRLQITWRQKLALTAIFVLGGFACFASVVRITVIQRLSHQEGSIDRTWDGVDLSIWSAVESGVGIVCACLPPMGPLLRSFVPDRFLASIVSKRSWPGSHSTNSWRTSHRFSTHSFVPKAAPPTEFRRDRSLPATGPSLNPVSARHETEVTSEGRPVRPPAEQDEPMPMGTIHVNSDVEWASARNVPPDLPTMTT
ncbi:MAG: hypothetical protein M1826_000283 [Phylliscum demangeonii]|nr:MAG: hypothetical protein M1826_000283 [Phylliscum demangeonii]